MGCIFSFIHNSYQHDLYHDVRCPFDYLMMYKSYWDVKKRGNNFNSAWALQNRPEPPVHKVSKQYVKMGYWVRDIIRAVYNKGHLSREIIFIILPSANCQLPWRLNTDTLNQSSRV